MLKGAIEEEEEGETRRQAEAMLPSRGAFRAYLGVFRCQQAWLHVGDVPEL